MLDSRKISIIIKIILSLIFLILIEFAIFIIYSYEIENRFFDESQDNVKFIVSNLEVINPNIVFGKIDNEKLREDLANISDYYKIENRFHLTVFKRSNGVVIYPIYSIKKRINREIEQITRHKIEGKIETANLIGYYFYYKPGDLSIIIYKTKREIFYYRNILLLSSSIIFLIFLTIFILIDIRKNNENTRFFREITNSFSNAFNFQKGIQDLKEIKSKGIYDKLEQQLIQTYNRMVKRINVLLKRQEYRIKEISKQRSNLRKLAYYYKKYSSDIPGIENINEHFVENFSDNRVPITVLSLKLINYFDQINEVYPELITRELESFYRYINSIIKNRGGFINYFEGNYVNMVFGLLMNNDMKYSDFFNQAIQTALDIHNWILDRNVKRNFSGVPWKDAMGITHGKGIAGVIGNNIIVIGNVVDHSKELMQYAEVFKVNCVTDSGSNLKDLGFKYRILDKINKKNFKEIYEIFLEENKNIDNAIKLYQHGIEMYFEEKYEIAVTEFKKVNQLLNPDYPSIIFLDRINLKLSGDRH